MLSFPHLVATARSLATAAVLTVAAVAGAVPGAARAQSGDDWVVQARDALARQDRVKLFAARQALTLARHPLAPWADYWELANRLAEAQQPELDAFYARWPGSYVEDRLRNDWLLELIRRRDGDTFGRNVGAFRMNDDREVACFRLLLQHQAGQDVAAAARSAWMAQREPDDGCQALARGLVDARVFGPEDVWAKVRQAAEYNRPRVARTAASLIGPAAALSVAELFDNPARVLQARPAPPDELVLLALLRTAAADPEAALQQLDAGWAARLSREQAASVLAHIGKQAALKLSPNAGELARRAWRLADQDARNARPPAWSDDLLAWQVRAALREPHADGARPLQWSLVLRAVGAMSSAEQADPAWQYWTARARLALAAPGPAGDASRSAATAALEAVASPLHFYGQLATEDLGRRIALPAAPVPLSEAERQAARANPSLARGLQLVALGLRNEGVREWNYGLRGLGERELLAAADWACAREVWDRCVNTSERTRSEVDVAQRYPTPFRPDVLQQSRASGIEAAAVYGLIRQESRFITDTRSHVGASGLMQLMPATARWTARRIGLDYRAEQINDREVNLRLGTGYLKLVLDDFGGSLPLAAAAYNAGPNRPRRWREGPPVETAVWAENIPFTETRDYVKKVLANTMVYAAVFGGNAPALKTRLGTGIGPRDATAPVPNRELP